MLLSSAVMVNAAQTVQTVSRVYWFRSNWRVSEAQNDDRQNRGQVSIGRRLALLLAVIYTFELL